jgi:cystathionine beta-lyase family protein involved in aluminum resistance
VKTLDALKRYSHLFEAAEEQIKEICHIVDNTVLSNQGRVLAAFQELQVDETCFYDSSGYGYNDFGREKLDSLYATVFGGEAGLVRPQYVSGTHAIASAIYGVLKPGERLVSLTGRPYDTLQKALGLTVGSNVVLYDETDMSNGLSEIELDRVLTPDTSIVFIQRSRGYAERRTLTVDDIRILITAVRQRRPDAVVIVDNCYGEFTEEQEPCHVGADLVAGSLIKNPGAGLASSGGYVVGRSDLVERAAWQLTAPGLGSGIGCMAGVKRLYYQGLFLAPHQVGQSLKGMILAASLFAAIGYSVSPRWDEKRGDVVQAVRLGSAEKLRSFCRAVQAASPVDSHVEPNPAPMVGYEDEIIMAAGTFVQGASSEFSADAPLRHPFSVYMQGGLTYEHIKLALAAVIAQLDEQFDFLTQ